MLIGVPKEIKAGEYCTWLIPATIAELVARGHKVEVESQAEEGAGISGGRYTAARTKTAGTADPIFQRAELTVKVKEPLSSERKKLHQGQMVFTYLHLAADREQTNELLASGATAITCETVTGEAGKLPLLGVVHYCVANMPGAVPRTSTFVLNNATRPFVLALADKGFLQAPAGDVHLRNGFNVHGGRITCRAVADALQLPYTPAADVIGA